MTNFSYRRRKALPALALGLAAAFIVAQSRPLAAATPVVATTAVGAAQPAVALQTAVLSGGCFWGVQGVFEHVRGVHKVISGYAGGSQATAQYETVSSGVTGHAESVQISFDPAEVSYAELLQVFFAVAHDPTQLNRQGPDTGTQYRSEIFYGDEMQRKTATDYIEQLNASHVYPRPIVTRVDPLKGFYAAEGYHQDYLIHNPKSAYIYYNDLPKIENLKRVLPDFYRAQAVTVASSSSALSVRAETNNP
jgi:peptide-methionine (S)-S-oxide reductase